LEHGRCAFADFLRRQVFFVRGNIPKVPERIFYLRVPPEFKKGKTKAHLTRRCSFVCLATMNEALIRHRKLLEQYPNNELARFSLGKAYFDLGQFSEAKEHFAIALSRKPDWMVVQILIGKCELALGDKMAAKAAFERAKQLAIAQNHEGPLAEMEQILASPDFEA